MSNHPFRRPSVTLRPSQTTVQAVIAAAALVACADGAVTGQERHGLIAFLRHHRVLETHGRARCLALFDQMTADTGTLSPREIHHTAARLRPVAGTLGAALVAQAAALMVLADGITWQQEVAVLEVIRDQIGLANPDPDLPPTAAVPPRERIGQ